MASEQMSLGDILSDEKPLPEAPAEVAPAPEAPPAPEVKDPVEKQQTERNVSRKQAMRDKEQAAQGRVRDPETGQYVTKDAAPAEPAKAAEPVKPAEPAKPAVAPQQEFTEKEKAFLRAAQEERGKRQQLEAKLKELEATKPQEPAKTFWDDPEASLKAFEERVKHESLNSRLGMAEFSARQRHPDFQENINIFSQLVQQNPALAQPWLASPDPAEYAYRMGKNQKDLLDVGGLEQMRAKIERETAARVRSEVEAELRAKSEALAKDRAALPPSLSDARSTGAPNRAVWNGPQSLDSILGKG